MSTLAGNRVASILRERKRECVQFAVRRQQKRSGLVAQESTEVRPLEQKVTSLERKVEI